MKLIEKLSEVGRYSTGSPKYLGKFFCEFCEHEVIRDLYVGKGQESCGCYVATRCQPGKNHWNYKHGESKTRLYKIWGSMIDRCDPNTTHKGNKRFYGDRGITVCDEWKHDFLKFKEWAEPRYKSGLQIDRINTNGNYAPENCRFITPQQNIQNSRQILRIKQLFPKVEKALDNKWTLRKIHKVIGVDSNTIYRYIKRGELKDSPNRRKKKEIT